MQPASSQLPLTQVLQLQLSCLHIMLHGLLAYFLAIVLTLA